MSTNYINASLRIPCQFEMQGHHGIAAIWLANWLAAGSVVVYIFIMILIIE